MKLLLAMATVLMLSSLSFAAHETAQLGPYNASFDMNTSQKYQVQMAKQIDLPVAAVYSMRIAADNATLAQITITAHNNLTDSTSAMFKQLMIMDLALVGLNTTDISDRTIDKKDGFVVTAMPMTGNNILPTGTTLFRAIYWLDSRNCSQCGPVSVGTTRVDITSTYSREVTQDLLDSLHIAKG